MTIFKSLATAAVLTLALTGLGLAKSRGPTQRDLAQAACYNDVMALCNDVVPDEAKIMVCMKQKRAQLSPGCGKIFDKGMKGKT